MLQITVSEQDHWLTSAELCEGSNIEPTVLYELVEHSIAIPIQGEVIEQWQFSVTNLLTVKKATRIKRDLALDWGGIALILDLLEERDELENEIHNLKQQLSRFSELFN